MTEEYYALYDTQLEEYKHNITGESIKEVAEDGADWWIEVSYDDELNDIQLCYECDTEHINSLYNISSYEEYEDIRLNSLKEMNSLEYLENKGFEIVKITALEYEFLNDEETLECPSDYELKRLCKNYKTKIYLK